MGCVYKATCLINGKVYIGKTISSLKKRIVGHRCSMKSERCNYFISALKKHGFDNFKWEVLEHAYNNEKLSELEVLYIDLYNSYGKGYNSTKGGEGMTGFKMSEESKQKIRIKATGKYIGVNNPNYGNKMSEESKNIIRSAKLEYIKRTGFNPMNNPESIEKVRLSKIGSKNPNFGMRGCFSHNNSIKSCEICGKITTSVHLKRHHGSGKCDKIYELVDNKTNSVITAKNLNRICEEMGIYIGTAKYAIKHSGHFLDRYSINNIIV